MKKRIIEVSKIVIFLSICVFLLNMLSPIFIPKNNNDQSGIKYENARGFYGENKDSIDVLAVGNSDLYSAMNPLQLWNEHGITSYVCAEPSQNIFSAYNILNEVLSCQKPKVILLEVDELFSNSEADDMDEAINNTLKNRFPIFEYHSRWKTLTSDDIQSVAKYDQRMQSKGYIYHNNIEKYYGKDSHMMKNRHTNITATAKLYLDKFMNLAHQNEAEVLFVWFPSATTATHKRHEVIQELANKYKIPFIDFNVDFYDTEFNWLTDTRDGGNHLNFSGATKMTRHLGHYLKNSYQLNDYRNNKDYEQWNIDYQSFIKENKIKQH